MRGLSEIVQKAPVARGVLLVPIICGLGTGRYSDNSPKEIFRPEARVENWIHKGLTRELAGINTTCEATENGPSLDYFAVQNSHTYVASTKKWVLKAKTE